MILLAIFLYCIWRKTKGGACDDSYRFRNTKFSFSVAWIPDWIGTTADWTSGGIRINVLICMGTSFFTLFPMLYGSDQMFRVGSSIISGVDFLCSGVIFKDGGSVRGINTVATLWYTAAIGILASTGMFAMAITAASILIVSNLLLRLLSRKVNPIISGDELEKEYRISITCQEDSEQDICLLLINSNTCKTIYLNNMEIGDVVGDKLEIIAEYCSSGKAKNHVLEEIVGKVLTIGVQITASEQTETSIKTLEGVTLQ